MTSIYEIFSVRSFRTSKDRNFAKALEIYFDNIHPQAQTESREIAYWLDNNNRTDAKFFVCGLYINNDLVGYVEFIHIFHEHIVHIDYFIIKRERRNNAAFFTFANQMRAFFDEEKIPWEFITAEVVIPDTTELSKKHAEGLSRLFRQVGFSEVRAAYYQPQLGSQKQDTMVPSRLMLASRVRMETLSKSRYISIIESIYHKHYEKWYSIYPEFGTQYAKHINDTIDLINKKIKDSKVLKLLNPENDFENYNPPEKAPLRDGIIYIGKILIGMVMSALFHYILKNKTELSSYWIFGILITSLALTVIIVSLTDKKRLEAFKLLISLFGKFLDN